MFSFCFQGHLVLTIGRILVRFWLQRRFASPLFWVQRFRQAYLVLLGRSRCFTYWQEFQKVCLCLLHPDFLHGLLLAYSAMHKLMIHPNADLSQRITSSACITPRRCVSVHFRHILRLITRFPFRMRDRLLVQKLCKTSLSARRKLLLKKGKRQQMF